MWAVKCIISTSHQDVVQIRLGDGDCLGPEAVPYRGGFFGFTGSVTNVRNYLEALCVVSVLKDRKNFRR